MGEKLKKDDYKKIEEIVSFVKDEFIRRQKERIYLERQWELNLNFLSGNQYCDISSKGEIVEQDKVYYWQNKNVFNHIAPIIESRLAKFSRINPVIGVRPDSEDDSDDLKAKMAKKLIESVFLRCKMSEILKQVTSWSETTGTGFYKIIWRDKGGAFIGEFEGKNVYEGEVEIAPVPPFEIYPDSLSVENLIDQKSIIHAKALSVEEIKRSYNVEVKSEELNKFNLGKNSFYNLKKENEKTENLALVIEYYERATSEFPNGRLIIVCGEKLLYYGELPYINGKNKRRVFPFVKQESCVLPGSFFGRSIIERLIPVQRSFNAVKNRKHEFLNRLSLGILTVEDGSIDVDDLNAEGLEPGKILVYRQGATPPQIMEKTDMPTSFDLEEEKLLNEFVIISGVSDVVSSSENSKVSSGTALQILVDQDNERLTMVAERIREAYLKVASQTLKLYAEFISGVKVIKTLSNFGKNETFYLDKNVADCEELYLETENELRYTEKEKKENFLRLYESGLLFSEDGKVPSAVKEKMLTVLGYKDLDTKNGFSRLQEDKAIRENQKLKTTDLEIEIIDDDEIHIGEHKRFVLSEYENLTKEQKQRFFAHIEKHKNNLAQK